MGPDQLTSVMRTVGKDDPALRDRIERESEAVFGSARLWDDGAIPPAHTRRVVGMGLRAAYASGWERPGWEKKEQRWGVFRM